MRRRDRRLTIERLFLIRDYTLALELLVLIRRRSPRSPQHVVDAWVERWERQGRSAFAEWLRANPDFIPAPPRD